MYDIFTHMKGETWPHELSGKWLGKYKYTIHGSYGTHIFWNAKQTPPCFVTASREGFPAWEPWT